MHFKVFRVVATSLLLFWSVGAASADLPSVVTWNINGGQQDKDILAENAHKMMLDIGDFDILVLQEVISVRQVSEIAKKLGFDYWAISDFSPPVKITGKWSYSLEVAVVSRKPFLKVVEWDPTGGLPTGDRYDPRVSDSDVATDSVNLGFTFSKNDRPSRGFLRVDMADGLSVYAAHWKSSHSKSDDKDKDLKNAAKRENNARGIVKDASAILAAGGSVIIAGDLNIQPIGKNERVGTDIDSDCKPSLDNCGSGGVDGYDDSMAILAGLENGYRLLSQDISPTYVGRDFGPGAIDHIAVAGPLASGFDPAFTVPVQGNMYQGSDHIPVFSGLAVK